MSADRSGGPPPPPPSSVPPPPSRQPRPGDVSSGGPPPPPVTGYENTIPAPVTGAPRQASSTGEERTIVPPSAQTAAPTVGALILNRYQVVRILGRGAMGEVLQVQDIHSGTEYALKRLPPEVVHDHTQMASIRANFALVSQLTHPHIAVTRFLEPDPATSQTYLIMDLVRGYDLARWISQQRAAAGGGNAPLPIETALGVAEQIAMALDYAHSLPTSIGRTAEGKSKTFGILHRDLKPANAMIEEGREYRPGVPYLRLVDFGLAAEVQAGLQSMSLAATDNNLAGTPAYMAPEQWEGRTLTRGIDQWALAVIIYEMVAGRRPFEAPREMALMTQVINASPEPPPNLTEAQWAALKVSFNKDRRQRHRSCVALVKALAEADPKTAGLLYASEIPMPDEAGGPSLAMPRVAAPAKASRFPLAAAIAVAAALLVGGGAAYFFLAGRPGSGPGPDTSAAKTSGPGLGTATTAAVSSVAANAAPAKFSVSLSGPGGVVQGQNVVLRATPVHPDGRVEKITFLLDGVPLPEGVRTEEPFEYLWTTAAARPKAYRFTVIASDDKGAIAISDPLTVTLNEKPAVTAVAKPTVLVTSPAAGTEVAQGEKVRFAAEVRNARSRIKRLVFLLDGAPLDAGERTEAPFEFSWSSAEAAPSEYTVAARAFCEDGTVAFSDNVVFRVKPKAAAKTAPETELAELRAALAQRLRELEGQVQSTAWEKLDPREIGKQWDQVVLQAAAARDEAAEKKADREAKRWRKEGAFRSALKEARAADEAFASQPPAQAEAGLRAVQNGAALAQRALPLASRPEDTVAVNALLGRWNQRRGAIEAQLLRSVALEQLKSAFEAFDADAAAGWYEKGERTLQGLEAQLFGGRPFYEVAPEARDRLAERRARAGMKLLREFFGAAGVAPLLNEEQERRAVWANGLVRSSGKRWTPEETKALHEWAARCPDLYEVPAPPKAVLAVDAPGWWHMPRALEGFFRASRGDELRKTFEACELNHSLTSVAKPNAGAWAFSEVLPWGAGGDRGKGLFATADDVKPASRPGFQRQAEDLVAAKDQDPQRALRRAGPQLILSLVLPEARGGVAPGLLAQAERLNLRIRSERDGARVDGRLRPRPGSALEKECSATPRLHSRETLEPFSKRTWLLAAGPPQSLLMNSLLRNWFCGPRAASAEPASETFLRALFRLLEVCGPQVTLGLDQDRQGGEMLLLVSDDAPKLRALLGAAEGTSGDAAANALAKELQGLALPPAKHGETNLQGFGFNLGTRRLRFRWAFSSGKLLAAFEDAAGAKGIEEALERLAGQGGDGLLQDRSFQAAEAPALASAYLLARPGVLTGRQDIPPLRFHALGAGGLGSFALEVDGPALGQLGDALKLYAAGGARARSWFAPELNRLAELLTREGMDKLLGP